MAEWFGRPGSNKFPLVVGVLALPGAAVIWLFVAMLIPGITGGGTAYSLSLAANYAYGGALIVGCLNLVALFYLFAHWKKCERPALAGVLCSVSLFASEYLVLPVLVYHVR